MSNLHSRLAVTLLAVALFTTTNLFGQSTDAVERGLEIATEADVRDTGFGDSQANMVIHRLEDFDLNLFVGTTERK